MSADAAVLVIGPSWVGDMVMAQSLFIHLRQRHPHCAIDVVAPEWSVALLQRMPEVRQAHVLPVGHGELGLLKRWRLAKALRNQQYEHAIVLPRSFKSALVPFWAGIPVRTGFNSELRYGLLNDIRKRDARLNQTVKRFVALGMEPGFDPAQIGCPQPSLRIDQNNIERLFDQFALHTRQPVIGLMPGAEYGPAKQWPSVKFAELAKKAVAENYAVWIFGSKKEWPLGEQILHYAGNGVVNLCGRTRLADAVDLISTLRVAVSNDSGLMHIAAATCQRVVAIYGSSSPVFTPPLSQQAAVEYLNLSCSPCFQRRCPLQHTHCLNHISVDAVFQRLKALAAL